MAVQFGELSFWFEDVSPGALSGGAGSAYVTLFVSGNGGEPSESEIHDLVERVRQSDFIGRAIPVDVQHIGLLGIKRAEDVPIPLPE